MWWTRYLTAHGNRWRQCRRADRSPEPPLRRSRRGSRAPGPHCADHRISGDHRRVPIGSVRQWRPTDALDTRWTFHFAARVVEERPPFAGTRRRGRPHHVGFRGGRDNRTLGQQNIGYDQGGCLSRSWRPEHERRALRAGPHPSGGAFTNIDAVARQTVDLAQCSSRNQARIGCVDMQMTVAFHGRDVCVGEQTNPWDI